MNTQYCRQIYQQLIHGKIINQHIYDLKNHRLQENPLFLELSQCYQSAQGYHQLYHNLGYQLRLLPSYAYLAELNVSADESSRNALAMQAVLTILARTVTANNFRFALLTDVNAGLSKEHCDQADQDEINRDILNACYCPRSLWQEAESQLVRRGIAFINMKQNLVLTNSGQDFFQQIFAEAQALE